MRKSTRIALAAFIAYLIIEEPRAIATIAKFVLKEKDPPTTGRF